MPTPSGLVTKQELIDAQLDTAHLGRVVNSKDASGAPINTSTNRTGGVNKTLDALEVEYLEAIQGAGGESIGTWAAGVTTFTKYNEYAVYNGIPYKPRTSATLPYVAQGADPTTPPDDANVQPYQEITEAQVVALVETTIPVELPKYTLVTYASTSDMIAGVPIPVGVGERCKDGTTEYKRVATNGNIDDFEAVNSKVGASDYVALAAERDAYYVGRDLKGLTDCHAFTDRTIISDVTDSGTYGTFDSVTKVEGTHSQSHQFSFQDRAIYAGSGAGEIGTWGNIVWPEKTSDGTVDKRYDFWVKDINNSGGGVTNTHIGFLLEDFTEATSNVAINSLQSTGYTIFAPNAGRWKIGGKIEAEGGAAVNGTSIFNDALYAGGGFKAGGLANGTAPISGVSVTLDKDGNPFQGFASVNSLGATFGVAGDNNIQLVTDGVTRVTVGDSSKGYDLAPTSNTQNLGNPSFLWKEVFSVNGTINTSDERLKSFIGSISEAEKRVAIQLKESLKTFKWNDSIEREELGGSKARIHFGIGVQTLAECFESEGLNPADYAMYCYDEWDDVYDEVCINEGEMLSGVESVTRQKTETKTTTTKKESVKLIDGKYVAVTEVVSEEVEVPVFETHLVFNEDGSQRFNVEVYEDDDGNIINNSTPVVHREPLMETVQVPYSRPAPRVTEQRLVAPAGNRYGVRLEQVNAFIIAAL